MYRTLISLSMVLGSVLPMVPQAAALSCAPASVQDLFHASIMVAEATPVKLVDTHSDSYLWMFSIDRMFKGYEGPSAIVSVEESVWPDTDSVPPSWNIGESYLIYFSEGAGVHHYRVGPCAPHHLTSIPYTAEERRVFGLDAVASSSFSDVPTSHPNADAIAYVRAEGIVEGYADGTYQPSQTINRAEFVKILTVATYGQAVVDQCGSRMQFIDVPLGAWYEKHVCRAKDDHLISGYPDGTFRPGKSINFVEAAKIIATADTVGFGPPDLPTETSIWYEHYVRYLANEKAIPLSIGSLDQQITRGEMAEIIWRLQVDVIGAPSRSYEELVPIYPM